MSRIVFATYGSLGDLHPVLALAVEMRRRGHDVTVATSALHAEKITAYDLGFHALPPAVTSFDERWVRAMVDGYRGPTLLLRDTLFPAVGAMYAELARAAAGADLLVTNELVYAARLLSEKTGLRWVSYSLAPMSLFSVFDPPLLPGPRGTHALQSLGPAANRVLRQVAHVVSHGWWRPVRRLRRELGLPPGETPLFEGKFSPLLDLALFSSVLQPPQPDWPASTVQCGFPFFTEHRHPRGLPAAVEEFLAAGDPPIVFTLGSSAVYAADGFYAESARAAQALGRRALLLLGENPTPPGLPPTIRAWDYLPYADVFPRAAAIVHQGGVGTTAQALRAGRPMLIMPFAFDQPDNAARIVRCEAGRRIARSRYRAPAVAAELRILLGEARYAARAARLGAIVRAENGVATACAALERLLTPASPAS